ncbi:MAG: hypothetical protein CEN89_130 [Candidatus Berkelbacteria bacterium Licking1014_7]|uniref:Uncharacterized protein n=1 Tax=Candidatus Berkelbacteria bacterium Licking1014_7 TaxID=2017147 RepID=A0A554LKH4_9BACT|nr:MAG: hypothetical protein CEN89_130 [Candidatus Berkelbacteria bacterium Licking1014_7]
MLIVSKIKQLNLTDLEIILATREIARFVVKITLEKNCNAISFKNAETASRSFLDELHMLSSRNDIDLIDIPDELKPLFDIIKKSHHDQKMYAPKIKVKLSDTFFA